MMLRKGERESQNYQYTTLTILVGATLGPPAGVGVVINRCGLLANRLVALPYSLLYIMVLIFCTAAEGK